ncbi:hypothetical protein CLHUN_33780 [Ruminiclostridium hungatei]|uniref:Protein-glutamine gamma-glutamyltransferase-like C-terminal domain-containing protein n=1 Tax=Ruminiclostridium hungatei TaxID=48256 RepID=A0A1V4SGW3_RUMHU|nr:DUF4129 domain-containing protein [Ruminiclostridium hungatei]OPX42726.1 hypothetical protein CLHUN_33780 [Ruminiclostridium hungatei]
MFGIFTLTSILEMLMLMPGAYMVLQFFMPPVTAFMLTCLFNVLVLAAIFICRLKPGPFVYKVVTVVISALVVFFTAGINAGGLVVFAAGIFIFSHVRTVLATGRDMGVQVALTSITINILLAIVFVNSDRSSLIFFGNIAIGISVAASVTVLVIKQVDDSRRFGKNSMDISSIQQKNNRIFAGLLLIILIFAGSFGQVTEIYKFVFRTIGWLFSALAGLFASNDKDAALPDMQVQELLMNAGTEDPSLLQKIFIIVIHVLGVLLVVGFIFLAFYHLVKFIINMAIRLINWFKSGQHFVDVVSECGHTDEKESLLDRNLKNFVNRFKNAASGIFAREIPYDSLTDDVAKVRRLMKYFIRGLRLRGVRIPPASTARELCRDAGAEPEAMQFNSLLAQCYDSARYADLAPEKEQLGLLEEKLLEK